jgi:hypothetical protein
MYKEKNQSYLLIMLFILASNTLLLSGLVGYGNDTGKWDIPYRALASALAEHGDLPLWYPNAGNGFPQLSFLWGSWTFPPLGILLGTLYPYNHLSLAIENLLWRLVGFAGSYLFAWQWVTHPIGAIAIAATYVGSGTMAWAALSYSALIGQMFAPWILAAGSIAIRATSGPSLATATGTLGLAAGLMVWSAYPGAWLTAPVLSGPLLLALALTHRGGLRRLFIAATAAFIIATAIISLILSESTSVPLVDGSLLDFRRTTDMREGLLRSIDLLGVFFVNPSYLPDSSSATMHPVYSGLVPIIVLASLFGTSRLSSSWVATLLTGSLALALANIQNWSSWDHPLFRDVPTLKALTASIPVPLIAVAMAVGLSGALWGTSLKLARVDTAMLAGIAWVLLVATDNPVANILRTDVPPFTLVRYNHLYFWLVTLLLATLAWRRVEHVTNTATPDTSVPPTVRTWGTRLTFVGVASLVVAALVAITTPDAYGLGAPPNGVSAMGSPHLAWQATILAIGAATSYLALRGTSGLGRSAARWAWIALVSSTVIAFAAACVTGVAFRQFGITPPTIPVTFGWQLIIDLAHGAAIIAAFALAFRKAPTQSALRTAIAAVMVFDVSLAVPRYFSDNDTVGTSQPGWPWPPFEHGQSGVRFLPTGLGDRKTDFAPPFEGHGAGKEIYGSFNPPPQVTRVREDWGALYEQWMHFPATWELGPGTDVAVQRTSLAETRNAPDCIPQGAGQPTAPSGRVTRLLATTVDVSFSADCDRLLVFTDSWAPGWSATIDGTPVPVLRVNNAIRAVMAPAGDHSLVWHYRPRFLIPLLDLLALGLLSSIALISTLWWSRWLPVRLSSRIDRFFGIGPVTVTTASEERPRLEGLFVDTSDARLPTGRRLPAWGIALSITVIGVAVVTSLSLYDARIDGSSDAFQRFLLLSAVAGAWAWLVVAGRVGFTSAIGPAILVIVMLPPLTLQVARHADPITRGAPVHTVASDFRSTSWQEYWEVVGRGVPPNTGPSGITLRNDGPNVRALSHTLPAPSPTLWAWWQRPLGTNTLAPSYEFSWTATVDRAGPYYSVFKLGRLTIQIVKSGILITALAPDGDVRGDFIAGASSNGSSVMWQLASNPSTSSLSLDGTRVWSGGSAGTAKTVVLGDATSDPEHRGTMTILSASVTQRMAVTTR